MGDDAVGHLAGDLVHAGPTAARKTRGAPYGCGGGAKSGHQGVGVEVALEDRASPRRSTTTDRPQREHELPHACRRGRPRELNRFSMCRRTCEPTPARRARRNTPAADWSYTPCSSGCGRRPWRSRCRATRGRVSAASANDRNGSFVVSAAQTQSSPAASAAATRSATRGSSIPRPLSIFNEVASSSPTPPHVVVAFLSRRRTGAGVGAGPLTAGASTDSDRGSPTWTKRPAAGCR